MEATCGTCGQDPVWRQFRFTLGAPDAEYKYKKEVERAQENDANARLYPSLYVSDVIAGCTAVVALTLWFRPFMDLRSGIGTL